MCASIYFLCKLTWLSSVSAGESLDSIASSVGGQWKLIWSANPDLLDPLAIKEGVPITTALKVCSDFQTNFTFSKTAVIQRLALEQLSVEYDFLVQLGSPCTSTPGAVMMFLLQRESAMVISQPTHFFFCTEEPYRCLLPMSHPAHSFFCTMRLPLAQQLDTPCLKSVTHLLTLPSTLNC